VNSVNNQRYCLFLRKNVFCCFFLNLYLIFTFLSGCGDQVKLPSVQQLNEFENAGPLLPSVDTENLVKAKISGSLYRVRSDDVLQLTMPAILQAVTKNDYREDEKYVPYICRISENGTINLPVVGELKVSGMTLGEIESAVTNQYYPEYAVTRPSVFAKVLEYKTAKVSITGAVIEPGVYSLRSDQMTLVNLIMEAKGIIKEGAAVIRITHLNNQTSQENENKLIPGSYKLKTIQTRQQLADTVSCSFVSNNTSNNFKMEVQLSFKRLSHSSTKGFITIQTGNEILLTRQIDIADLLDRLLVIKQLLNEHRISILELEQKLTELADKVKQKSEARENQSNIVSKNLLKPAANREFMRISQSLVEENTLQTTGNNTADLQDSELTSSSIETATIEAQKKETDFQQSGNSKTIVLPVKGLYIPFADVVLEDGDSVTVERMQMPFISVLGLVTKPGTYEYQPDVHLNLLQALSLANGLDRSSDPRYATIYRLKADGTITHAIIQVVKVKNRSKLALAMSTNIKPGDVIIVEDTPRTRANTLLNRIINFNLGAYYNLEGLWNRQ
jgi:protein involved in polysaccharide export with SLBB domain